MVINRSSAKKTLFKDTGSGRIPEVFYRLIQIMARKTKSGRDRRPGLRVRSQSECYFANFFRESGTPSPVFSVPIKTSLPECFPVSYQ
ncbi:uncharacterized protein METZ01_LOCUS381383, partial [marine metagenome]